MKTPYVGFFRRALAFVLDLFVVQLVPSLIVSILAAGIAGQISTLPEGDMQTASVTGATLLLGLLWQVLFILAYWLYFASLESSSWQATLGKKLLRIKVVDAQGARLRFGRATARAFSRLISHLSMNIGFIMAGCTQRNQALHDMIVQTYVVQRDFQPQDGLPETPSHLVWLIIWSVLWVTCMLIGFAVSIHEAQQQAIPAQAAQRLQELAQEQNSLPEPLQEDIALYVHLRDGYRAILEDAHNNTLFLANGSTTVCCEGPQEECQTTGFAVCQ